MSLTKSTEDLRNAQSLAAELAKSAGSALETIEALALELKDNKKQAALLSEALRHLIGDPKTEGEIADPVPGGNGGIFKAKETLAKGHGISGVGAYIGQRAQMAGSSNSSSLTGETDTDEYGADVRGVGDNTGSVLVAADKGPEAKEGGTQ